VLVGPGETIARIFHGLPPQQSHSSQGCALKKCIVVLAMLAGNAVNAAVPAEFNPLVVEAPFSFFVREFDLTRAFEKARAENKPMFIYLDAWDCPPCKEYAEFLSRNIEPLKPHFAKVVVVDIRTSLRGSALAFKIRDKRYSFEEFKTLVGDYGTGLAFPYYWLIAPSGRQVKQLPRGSINYTELDKHIRILNIP
jgi:hypothetical protein